MEIPGSRIIKSGVLKKRSARMHQWATRYFVLTDHTLSYKLKQDAPSYRGSFDLVPGCIVTQIEVESRNSIKGKKYYTFWVVWPHDKSGKGDAIVDKNNSASTNIGDTVDSDEEGAVPLGGISASSAGGTSSAVATTLNSKDQDQQRVKNLKQIVESEVLTQRRQKSLVEEQIEMHHARDNNISLGTKVAAVAVGGVVVGGLTAGIGLVPYLAVVGVTAIAGGGAVAYQWRSRPSDSRIILSCDSMEEAVEWRAAIEHQIQQLEVKLKPAIPAIVDTKVISSILDRSIYSGTWRRVDVCEGMRIVEHVNPLRISQDTYQSRCYSIKKAPSRSIQSIICNLCQPCSLQPLLFNPDCAMGNMSAVMKSSRCRRAQISIPCTPINTFLRLMNFTTWPKQGSSKVVKDVDDHAELIGVEVKMGDTVWRLCISRFWKLEDEGIYLITFNSIYSQDFPFAKKGKKDKEFVALEKDQCPTVDAVITVAPRADFADYEYDVMDTIVTCSCQIAANKYWNEIETSIFMNEFLKDHLLELRNNLLAERFSYVPSYSSCSIQQTAVATLMTDDPPSLIVPGRLSRATSIESNLNDQSPLKPPLHRGATTSAASSTGNYETQLQEKKLTRRGVTTVQPGMEDLALDHPSAGVFKDHVEKPQSAYSRSPVPSGNDRGQQRRIMSLFSGLTRKPSDEKNDALLAGALASNDPLKNDLSAVSSPGLSSYAAPSAIQRVLSGRGVPSPNTQATTDDYHVKRAASAPSKSSPSVDKKKLQLKKDKRNNIEAKRIRANIGATEFEVERLTKSMKTEYAGTSTAVNNKNSSSMEKRLMTPAEYLMLQEQVSELHQKLSKLKQQYLDLTGMTYEEAKERRSTFARLRGLRHKNRTTNIIHEEAVMSSLSGGPGAGLYRSNIGQLPVHWSNQGCSIQRSWKKCFSMILFYVKLLGNKEFISSLFSDWESISDEDLIRQGNYTEDSRRRFYLQYRAIVETSILLTLLALALFSTSLLQW